jgi:hypothetical protein
MAANLTESKTRILGAIHLIEALAAQDAEHADAILDPRPPGRTRLQARARPRPHRITHAHRPTTAHIDKYGNYRSSG